MKIDTALTEFTERYDSDAMASIDSLSKQLGLVANRRTIPLFNMKESFDNFSKYLEQYGDYLVKNKNNPKASSREIIQESTKKFINDKICNESVNVLYASLPEFVQSYVEGVEHLHETIDSVKNNIEFNEVDLEYAGDVNEYADAFMEKMNTKFYESMHRILWASGYNANKGVPKLYGETMKKQEIFV